MRVFIDEDTGAGIGRALRAVGIDAEYVARDRSIKPGTPDEIWIRVAGEQSRLVLSRNLGILKAEAQTQLLVQHRVAIVFLPQHVSAFALLELAIRTWTRL